ncbi:MAG: hypothetical protein DRI93_01225 [Aquificota bacterium]|nr:MAG: hypothetical protein DRI93_01225 [Aquificota bacterium]RLD96569.1 MAG: hypothetical protein DRI91_06900 [Aquificota bacterium]
MKEVKGLLEVMEAFKVGGAFFLTPDRGVMGNGKCGDSFFLLLDTAQTRCYLFPRKGGGG